MNHTDVLAARAYGVAKQVMHQHACVLTKDHEKALEAVAHAIVTETLIGAEMRDATPLPPRPAMTTGRVIDVYTDGACSRNPGPGGWAYAVAGGVSRSGAEKFTTNNQMELLAVLRAVEDIDGDLKIVSDSAYVVNCFKDRWWTGWLARGWLKTDGKPVVNRELWEPLIDAVQRRGITFHKVKGHSGDPMNERVDRLACLAAQTQRGINKSAV